MSFFDKIKKAIFSHQEPGEPFIREELVRGTSFLATYDEWKNRQGFLSSIDFIKEQFGLATEAQNAGMFRLLLSGYSNGFMLRYPEGMEYQEFHFLFDYLKERVRQMGYLPYMSDRQSYDRKDKVEMVERHYLKPSWRAQLKENGGQINQLYGNMSIELFLYDDIPSYIKLMCNAYNDRKYKQPLAFDHFMDQLTQP